MLELRRWHLFRVERLLKLRRRILLGDGSVKLRELQCGYLPSKHGFYMLHELCCWELLRDHGTVCSHGALLCRNILWLIGERVPQLRCRDLSISRRLLILSDVQHGHVPDERRCIKLFKLRRWNLLVVGCELVFELCGRHL